MLGHAIGLAILSARMVTCQSASWQKTTQNDETASGSDRIRHVVFTDLITSSNLPNYAKDIKTYRTWIELVMGLCHSAAWYSVRPHAPDEIAALLEKPLNVDPQSTSPKPHNHAWPWSLILRQVATHAFGWSHRKAPGVLRNWELITAALMPDACQISNHK